MKIYRLLLPLLCLVITAGAQRLGATPRFGAGFQISTLGPGAQFAVRVLPAADLRLGFNHFAIARGFNHDGIDYNGRLQLQSASLQFDWFFWRSFHLSPGALIYNGNQVSASAIPAPGSSFTLGGVSYTSDPANPLVGTGQLKVRRFAPMFTLGSGRLVNQDGGHFGVSFEIGMAVEGTPQTALNLSGNVCPVGAPACEPASSPDVQSNIVAEQNKLNSQFGGHWYSKVYPILGLGFHYAF